jgi:hypothetical protein
MKPDMSPEAVSLRLKQASDLRRLCIELGGERLKRRLRVEEEGSRGESPEEKIDSAPRTDQRESHE